MLIYYSYKAASQLASLEALIQSRIAEKMRFFATQSDPIRFAKYIAKKGAYRFRVGDHRVFFGIEGDKILIQTIERRDKAYD